MQMRYIILAVPTPVALHSHASSVPVFNGLNFSNWSEQIRFHLGVLDLDSALEVEEPAITDTSSAAEKSAHNAWVKSNKLSLMFMRMSVADNIKSTIPKTESVKEFMNSVKERSQTADKSVAGTLATDHHEI
ncbi:uncharacterized protein LOC131008160 [Salvia miltiorrhiza]|uniref:uncharacterized protein LOC131008160 n=1 Tax=Salvia miltiorrhiza TaxID=226208 RepID=UPI0025AC44FF|nr:uncharacterized protein LOC131008160 [Salvia miltiorrhiza]